MKETIRIIGIDPGLLRTGWGIVESLGNSLHFIGSGTVTSNAEMDLASRLCQLHEGLSKVLHEFMPHEAAVEHTFVNKDATATLKLGQARGIALLAPAQAGLPVAEYAPNAVKKAVIGVGHGGEAADPHDGEGADAARFLRYERCRRCAGHRHMSCASPAEHRECPPDAGIVSGVIS